MTIRERDRKYLARDESPRDLQLTRAGGNYIYDAKGKKYLDFLMGWCVGNFGLSNRQVRSAVRRSTAPDYVHPSLIYRP